MPTTPPTFVDATELPASDLNLIRDAILELQAQADGATYMAVQVTKTSQTISDSTPTEVSWATQVFDIGGAWSSGTDIVIPASWVPSGSTAIACRVIARGKFAANATGARTVAALLNGVEFGSKTGRAESAGVTDTELIEIAPTCEVGDIITVEVEQTSGGNLSLQFAQITVERAGVTA